MKDSLPVSSAGYVNSAILNVAVLGEMLMLLLSAKKDVIGKNLIASSSDNREK